MNEESNKIAYSLLIHSIKYLKIDEVNRCRRSFIRYFLAAAVVKVNNINNNAYNMNEKWTRSNEQFFTHANNINNNKNNNKILLYIHVYMEERDENVRDAYSYYMNKATDTERMSGDIIYIPENEGLKHTWQFA